MSENDDAQPGTNDTGSSVSSLGFEQTLKHLAAGYQNSQNVVRFLDTKAAAVVGGVPVFLGICAAVIKWMHDVGIISIGENAGLFEVFVAIALLITLVFAFLSLQAAFTALLPNDTGAVKSSVIFPYQNEDFQPRLALFVQGAVESDAIDDYQRQITRMSEIVKIKLTAVDNSIRMVRCLLAAAVVSGFLLVSASFFVDGHTPDMCRCVESN